MKLLGPWWAPLSLAFTFLAANAASCSPTLSTVVSQTEAPSHTGSPAVSAPDPAPSGTPSLPPNHFSISDVAPGEYLLAVSLDNPSALGEAPRYSLYLISMEGNVVGRLAEGPGPASTFSYASMMVASPELDPKTATAISPKYVFRLYDLNTSEVSVVPGLFDSDMLTWGPGADTLATSSNYDPAQSGTEIEMVDIHDGSRTRLTYCSEIGEDPSCYYPEWSPDGRWIKYNLALGDQLGSPLSGAYVLDTVCLPQPTSCTEASTGPFHYGESAEWSPKSDRLAFVTGDEIAVLDVATSTVVMLPDLDDSYVRSLAWSPDAHSLAFTQSSDAASAIFLMDMRSGLYTRLLGYSGNDVHVLAWIRLPPS